MRKRTRREEIVVRLSEVALDFEQLRTELDVPVHVLDEDLRHVARSVRATGGRLKVERPECVDCGFRFRRESFKPPGRCPRCRSHRISGPVLRVELPAGQ
jgi:predicted Zn-ribbon and HTH transcriptional regulator